MIRCKMYRIPFTNLATIHIENIECSYENMLKLINIFKPKCVATKILAIDRNDHFFKVVSDERFYIVFPPKDTITSETTIVSKANDFISVYEALIKSDPRCVSFYEIESLDNLPSEILTYSDEYLIKKGVINYSVALIVEENFIKILFDKNVYNSSELFKSIKRGFG